MAHDKQPGVISRQTKDGFRPRNIIGHDMHVPSHRPS